MFLSTWAIFLSLSDHRIPMSARGSLPMSPLILDVLSLAVHWKVAETKGR
jgi:hypothetical protein